MRYCGACGSHHEVDEPHKWIRTPDGVDTVIIEPIVSIEDKYWCCQRLIDELEELTCQAQ